MLFDSIFLVCHNKKGFQHLNNFYVTASILANMQEIPNKRDKMLYVSNSEVKLSIGIRDNNFKHEHKIYLCPSFLVSVRMLYSMHF